MHMSIGLGKTFAPGCLCLVAALALSGCGRYSFNEKEQHLYETAERIKAYASNPATKNALIQSKYSSQMMDKSFGMIDQVRKQGEQQQAIYEQQKQLMAQATSAATSTGPAAQQIVSQYPTATDTATATDAAAGGEAAGGASPEQLAAIEAARAKIKALRTAQLQQFQSMTSSFDPAGMQAQMQQALSKDMTPSDLARALAEQDKNVRGMTKGMSKIPDTSGTTNKILSVTDNMINMAMPTHIYYVTPETPWSIAVSGEDSEHKLVCRGYGDDLSTPKFVDEYDMTWK